MRVLIVDDEPLARKVLRDELGEFPDVQIAGEAESGEDALARIRELRPDLVLLDLQMPGMSGLEVVQKLEGGSLPVVVFVTAYDQYAIRAFEAGAIDYLLKPVSGPRLAAAVARAKRLTGKPRETAEHVAAIVPKKIVGRAGEEYFLLGPDEVLAFQADGDLVWIITARRKYLATQTLKGLEEKLQGLSFLRVHRNAIVNVTHVRKMAALSSNRWLLTLHNDLEFTVSKRQAHAVRSLLDT